LRHFIEARKAGAEYSLTRLKADVDVAPASDRPILHFLDATTPSIAGAFLPGDFQFLEFCAILDK
jgi:hypothetical protein